MAREVTLNLTGQLSVGVRKPTTRGGRDLVVGLRSIIRDKRASPKLRLTACQLLMQCMGIISPNVEPEQKAISAGNANKLRQLLLVPSQQPAQGPVEPVLPG